MALGLVAAGCGPDSIAPLETAAPGVVFTYPIDAQLDVPLGTRIVVTFSDPVVTSALGSITIEGPAGPLSATAEIVNDGHTVQFTGAALEPGTTYGVVIKAPLAPTATNLPTTGPLFSFTTRTAQPRAAIPTLVAINGGPAATPTAFRPMFETTTIRLLFSEPLDPRTVTLAAGAIELLDSVTRMPVPATLVASGVHVSIDPRIDLTAGATYELRLGNRLLDLGGVPVTPTTVMLSPINSRGTNPIPQVLRTRQPMDPGPATSRSGATRNVIAIDKPLIGREESTLLPATLAAELGDPKVLGGPIAFTIRKGQRLSATGLDIKLGGDIPVGLSTGDIQIEILTDGGGRIYRNPHQLAEQRPENERAPLYVDLSLDVAVYATDPAGNAVLTQTVLGVQAAGTAIGTGGVLAIESVAAMELGLLGVTQAPTNLVLELITDPTAKVTADATPPTIVATSPVNGTAEHIVDSGIEVIFDEPVDLDRLRAGGMRLETGTSTVVPSVIESHGAAVVIRPIAPLGYSTIYRVVMSDVADVAGNSLAAALPLSFATPRLVGSNAPPTVLGIHPGVPCALTGATATTAGRCSGGAGGDQLYRPFTLPANEAVQVMFDKSIVASSIALGAACNTGSVRVEQLTAGGTCMAAVAGTVIRRDRSLAFIPDRPWTDGTRYRFSLISGGDGNCGAGELCGLSSAPSFDPLNGLTDGDAGGPNLAVDFTGAPPTTETFLFAQTGPFTDTNGSGFLESGEVVRDENRAALRITGTTGDVGSASFNGTDCVPGTPQKEACMYIAGALPVSMGDVTTDCPLPGGVSAASCLPVTLSPQAMLGTSVSMSASVGISINTDTGGSVMRVREPAGGGQVVGYIYDEGGTPTMIVALDLYMDAPDMSIPLSSHDLHSKQMSAVLRGPVSFLPDGRIQIAVSNAAEVPVTVSIDAPLGLGGSVNMIVPAGEMKLQLVSPSARGVLK
jgi:hypothetical protein